MRFLPVAALVSIGLPLHAQADHFTTNPEGYDFSEGNSHSEDLLGTEPLLRFQQIDATSFGDMLNRNRVAWRRDGRLLTNPIYGSRTVEIEIVLAESDLDTISTTFAANYKTNMAVVVAKKSVVFEDWIVKPAIPPASESNVIPLDGLWGYQGKNATGNDLLWEVRIFSNTQAGTDYPFDFEYVVPNATFGIPVPTTAPSLSLSTGCTIPQGAGPHTVAPTFLNYGPVTNQMELRYASYNGPPNQNAVLFLDAIDRGISLPQLCNTLHSTVLSTPLGVADNQGIFILSPSIQVPHTPHFIGQKMVIQDVRTCPGCFSPGFQLDVSFSNGVELTVPGDPQPPAVGRVWALDPTATTATFGPLPGGVILYTNHT